MRDVPMTDELASYLEEEKERQRRYAAFKGEELTDESPVVANKRGGFANPNTLSQMFKEFAIDTGVNPEGSFKSMRAGVASVLASQNVPMPDAARLLGHAEITTTARYYIKYVNDPAMPHIAETLRDALTA